jgi:hypothetical protein
MVPIKIEFDPDGESLFGSRGVYYPVAVCDICGERIADIGLGAYLYDTKHGPLTKRTILDSEIIFAHKGSCLDVAEARVRGSGWSELSWFPKFLEKNSPGAERPKG